MIKKIILDNFRSFGHIELDLTGKKNTPKNLAFIYGENGSGKTNLVEVFNFLQVISTKKYVTLTDETIDSIAARFNTDMKITDFISAFEKDLELSNAVSLYKTIDSTGGMKIYLEYVLNGKNGDYTIEFDDNNILIYEKLRYSPSKRISTLFEIGKGSSVINMAHKSYKKDLNKKVEKQWGRLTFLGILTDEYENNNIAYMKSNIINCFDDVFHFFSSLELKNSKFQQNTVNAVLMKKRVSFDDKKLITMYDKGEKQLNKFFTSLYADIKQVYFEKKEFDGYFEYELYVKKYIAGKLRKVPFIQESTGTKNLILFYDTLFNLIAGNVVICDEFDSGVHDILMAHVVENIPSDIKGQLIATTHNTNLLQSLPPENAYIIQTDAKGYKQIVAISDITKTQKNHNNRQRYLSGLFGGIPEPGYIDMYEIFKE